ncbi:hypothetical protein DFH07DRAFT_458291 [Mycena maculata]|uniref:Uncharacterized protein n=1 Tax=Mycena maculata TaxID=230809 RepID=A0AAD7J5T5_9AGAR|nr:hypothetical protein DFH07DRAFT_458291 [Mycena maculata]
MAFSPCSTLPTAAMNIDDYFDFDAASCDPSTSPTTCREFLHVQSAAKASPGALEEHIVFKRLVLERDAPYDSYQIKVDVDGIRPEAFYDATIGLPLTAWLENPEAYDSSDSDSCSAWSAPGSPFSFLSTLSPPLSPVNCHSSDSADGYSSDADDHFTPLRSPSPAPLLTIAPAELSTASCKPETTTLNSFDCASNAHPFEPMVHAPRPISLRRDVVGGLETMVHSPPRREAKLEAPCYYAQPPQRLELEIIQLDFNERPPSRPPSCKSEGHRVGKSRRRSKGSRKVRSVCPFPRCKMTATRPADINRHCETIHCRPCLPQIYAETGKDRLWCMGCLMRLSRSDSRVRHEKTCPHFADYLANNCIRNPILFLPLPEIYAENDRNYRLWCLACFATFPHPGDRHAHEGDCKRRKDAEESKRIEEEKLKRFDPIEVDL